MLESSTEVNDTTTKKPAISGLSRRALLRTGAIGSGAAFLSGCLGFQSGGSDTIKIGALTSLSGAYAAAGEKMEQAFETAVRLANENGDAGGREIEMSVKDTKADPATGKKVAREHLNNDVDLLIGSVSVAIAQAVIPLAQEAGVVYLSGGGGQNITGEDCQPTHFSAANNPIPQSRGALRYVFEQGAGPELYTITSNFAWGQNHLAAVKNYIQPNYDFNHLGNTFTESGQGDYSQALSEADNADPDIIYMPQYGADLVRTTKQAADFGLLDKYPMVWPVTGIVPGSQLDQSLISHENWWSGLWWYYQQDNATDAAQAFYDSYKEEYDERPEGYGGLMYAGIRTLFHAVGDAESTNPDDLIPEMEGRKYDTPIWGVGEYFRECDHAAIYPMLTVKGKSGEVSGQAYYDVVNTPKEPITQYRDCANTDCEMD